MLNSDETYQFLTALFPPSASGVITFTAIHPDRHHPTPSRHIARDDSDEMQTALICLMQANAQGWGAFVGVATRHTDLGRWRRGGLADLGSLSALFVDLDMPVEEAQRRLKAHDPPPSCVVASGGGVHAYWWLDQPTTDWVRARQALQHLQDRLGSDRFSLAQSLRVPGSRNTKPQRHSALCHVLALSDTRYPLKRFLRGTHPQTDQTDHFRVSNRREAAPFEFKTSARAQNQSDRLIALNRSLTRQTDTFGERRYHSYHRPPMSRSLNACLISAVVQHLEVQYEGCWQPNGWLAALCPCGHAHDRPGRHFAFNPVNGVGVCLGRHGAMRLKDLCHELHLDPMDYGGFYTA